MPKILFLGLGFVSAALASFMKDDHEVYMAFRRRSNNVKEALLRELRKLGVKTFEFSKIDRNTISKAFLEVRPDVVVNCIGRLTGPYEELYEAHVKVVDDLCNVILELCPDVMAFHISSAYIVGRPKAIIEEEERHLDPNVIRPKSSYERTKVEGERIFMNYVNKGLKGVILRPVLMYGPYNYHEGLNDLIKYARMGIHIIGRTRISMLSVVNLAITIDALIRKFNRAIGEFIIVSEGDYTIGEIFEEIINVINVKRRIKINVDFMPKTFLQILMPKGLRHFVKYLNCSFKSRKICDYVKLDKRLKEDFRRQVEWYLSMFDKACGICVRSQA